MILSLVQDPDTGMGDVTPSAREDGARAPLPSTFSHQQEGQWLWPPLPTSSVPATWLGSACRHHTTSTCLGPIQSQLCEHVTCAVARNHALGKAACLI